MRARVVRVPPLPEGWKGVWSRMCRLVLRQRAESVSPWISPLFSLSLAFPSSFSRWRARRVVVAPRSSLNPHQRDSAARVSSTTCRVLPHTFKHSFVQIYIYIQTVLAICIVESPSRHANYLVGNKFCYNIVMWKLWHEFKKFCFFWKKYFISN